MGGGLHVMCEQMLLQLNMQLSIKVELVEVVLDHSHLKMWPNSSFMKCVPVVQ